MRFLSFQHIALIYSTICIISPLSVYCETVIIKVMLYLNHTEQAGWKKFCYTLPILLSHVSFFELECQKLCGTTQRIPQW